MIPRSNTADDEDTLPPEGTEETDNPEPLEFDSMSKAHPRGGSKRKQVKNRSWKASVAVYNDL